MESESDVIVQSKGPMDSDTNSGMEDNLKNRFDKQVAENQILRAKLKGYETLGQLHQDAKNELKEYKKKFGPIVLPGKPRHSVSSETSSPGGAGGSDPPQGSGSGHFDKTMKGEVEKDTVSTTAFPSGSATASSSARGSVISQPSGTNQPENLQHGHRGQAVQGTDNQENDLPGDVEEDSNSFTEEEDEDLELVEKNKKKSVPSDQMAEHLGFILPSLSSGQSMPSDQMQLPSLSQSSGGQSSDQLVARGGGEVPGSDQGNDQGNYQIPESSARLQLAQALHKSGVTMSLPESIEVSMHVPHVATVLHKYTGNGEETPVAADLARISLHMVKLEKENRQYRSLVSALSADNSELKNRIVVSIPERDRTIRELRQENGRLKQTIIKLQQERHSQGTSLTSASDWVTVSKQGDTEEEQIQKSPRKPSQIDSEMVEALQQRLAKIVTQRNELLEVNHKWSGDYSKLQQEYQQEVLQLKRQLNESQQQLAAHVSLEEKRQRDVDSLLLSAKKRTEVEENAKEEALQLLHLERQKRQDLEEQFRALESGVQQESRPLDARSRRNKSPSDIVSNASNETMRNEIAVLQQQVTMFKEDFDQERRDRERLQDEKFALEEASNRLKEQLTSRDQRVDDLVEEVDLKRDEIRRLERQIRDLQYINQSGSSVSGGRSISTGTAAPSSSSSQSKWACKSCTYLNASSRTVCEVCGTKRNSQGSGYRSSSCGQVPQRRLLPRGEDVPDDVFEDSAPFYEE